MNRGVAKLVQDRWRKRCAPQIRMQHDSGCVDDRLQRSGKDAFDFARDDVFKIGRNNRDNRNAFFAGDFRADAGNNFARHFHQ